MGFDASCDQETSETGAVSYLAMTLAKHAEAGQERL
jgi:hypothetical protein